MKKRKLAHLILGSVITQMSAEEFIDVPKEMSRFGDQYGFGTPIATPRQSDTDASFTGERNESNSSTVTVDTLPKEELKPLKKELNISCGAKCGINFKSEENSSS